MPLLATMVVEYVANTAGLTKGVVEATKSMQAMQDAASKSTSGMSFSFKNAAGGLLDFGAKIGHAIFGVKELAGTAVDLAGALLAPNASMEQTKVGFETLLGKGKATEAFLKELSGFAASTPFEFPELAENAQHMLAFGFTAKEVIPTLTDIGDAMSAMGKGSADIDRVVNVFGQMKAAGRANAGDMMQLTTMGIPAWKFLAAAMHKTIPEVQDLSSKGLIPAKTAIDALTGGMHGMFGGGMKAQATTFNGLLSTLKDNAGLAMRAFTGPLFNMAKDGMTQLGNLVSGPQFQQFATTMGEKVGAALQVVGQFVTTNMLPAFMQLAPVAQDLGNWFAMSFQRMMPLLGQIGQVIGQVFGNIANYIASDQFAGVIADFQTLGNQIGQILGPVLQNIGPIIQQGLGFIGTVLTGTVIPAIDTLIFSISQVISFFQQNKTAAEILGAALIGIGVAFAAIQVGSFIAAIPGIIAGFIAWGAAAWTAAAGVIAATWPILAIGAAIAVLVAIIVLAVQHWGDIVAFLQGVWAGFSSWFMGLLGAIGAFFTGIWNGIATFFVGIWQQLTTSAQTSGNAVSSFFMGIWGGIVAGLQAAWAFIVAVARVAFQLLFMIIMGPIIGIAQGFIWLYNHNYYFQALVDFIVNAFKAGLAWVQNAWTVSVAWLAGLWASIVAIAQTVWGALVAAIMTAVAYIVGFVRFNWELTVAILTGLWRGLSAVGSAVWGAISGFIMGIVGAVVGWLRSVWGAAVGVIGVLWGSLKGLATNAWNAVTGVFRSAWGSISGALSGLWNNISKWFKDLATQAIQFGKNIIQGFIDGIRAMIGAVGKAAGDVVNAAKNFLGFHSPTKEGPGREADKWAPAFVDMYAKGIEAGIPRIEAAVNRIMTPMAFRIGGLNIKGSDSPVMSAAKAAGGSASTEEKEIHVHIYLDGREMTDQIMERATRQMIKQGVH